MDFHRVTGMDATATRSCFLLILQQICKRHEISSFICGCFMHKKKISLQI
jgi:hypothetical protein